MGFTSSDTDPQPYLNDYRNAIRFCLRQLDQGGRVFFALDTTHEESAALFESVSERLTTTRIWYQHKPNVMAGMELWEIHDLLKTPG